MRPNRAEVLNKAPLADLIAVVLRQYKRLLAERGIELTEANIKDLVLHIAAQTVPAEQARALRTALINIVTESEQVLAGWNLTFEQSLQTKMSDIPGWESTSEFLEIANEKGNAELRISSASALVAALGDLRYASYLLFLINHDPYEVDAVIARRILLLLSGVDGASSDWLAQVHAWLEKHKNAN